MIFKNKVALIVDDSLTIRHQIKLLLRKHNISVLEASDKKSMLNNLTVNNKVVDIIIMDLGLKDTTGFDLMDALRLDAKYAKIPIIVLTGNASKMAVLTAAKYKIAFYAVKPINPNDLISKILFILSNVDTPEVAASNFENEDEFDIFADFESYDVDELEDIDGSDLTTKYFKVNTKPKK